MSVRPQLDRFQFRRLAGRGAKPIPPGRRLRAGAASAQAKRRRAAAVAPSRNRACRLGAGAGAWRFALAAALAWPAQALAQADARDTVEIDPVVVSVLQTPDPLVRVPFAVSVLDGPDLVLGGAGVFIEEALHGLAGVRVQNRYNPAVGERISIRGFGARAQFGVRGVKILVDGMPATLPDGQSTLDHLDVGSLGRVEALRGPGAAFYGNGAGGVLLFRSAPPFEGPYRQDATVAAGSHGLLRLQATASGTAGRAVYRASFARNRFDGFRDNPTGAGEDPYSQATRTTANAGVAFPAGSGVLSVRLAGVDLDALNGGSLPARLFDAGSSQAWGFNVARRARKAVKQIQAGARWQRSVGSLETDVSMYGARRELDNPIPTSVIDLHRNAGGVRVALGKAWGDGDGDGGGARFDFGGEAEVQDDDRRNFANQNGERGRTTLDQRERVQALAAFGRLGLPLGEQARILGALRVDRIAFRADDGLVGADDPDDSGRRTMTAVSPSLGVYVGFGRHGAFASVARSFETPTTTELANRPEGAGGLNPDLGPQRGWTFEGGLRGVLGARASYDVAGFWTRLSGQLIPFEVASSPGRRFYRNSGLSRVRGAEVSVRAAPSAWLAARASYSYVDARFVDFAVNADRFDGNRIPGVAPHRIEAAVKAALGPWFAELRAEARGKVPADNANAARAERFVLLDVRVGGTGVRAGRLDLSPFGGITNVAGVRYASSVVVNAFGGRYFEPGPGRGGYAGVSVAWDRGW